MCMHVTSFLAASGADNARGVESLVAARGVACVVRRVPTLGHDPIGRLAHPTRLPPTCLLQITTAIRTELRRNGALSRRTHACTPGAPKPHTVQHTPELLPNGPLLRPARSTRSVADPSQSASVSLSQDGTGTEGARRYSSRGGEFKRGDIRRSVPIQVAADVGKVNPAKGAKLNPAHARRLRLWLRVVCHGCLVATVSQPAAWWHEVKQEPHIQYHFILLLHERDRSATCDGSGQFIEKTGQQIVESRLWGSFLDVGLTRGVTSPLQDCCQDVQLRLHGHVPALGAGGIPFPSLPVLPAWYATLPEHQAMRDVTAQGHTCLRPHA